MSKSPDNMVSIIGTAYLAPINRLMEHLFSMKRGPSYKAQAGYYENGYSVSIILLWVAMLESFTVRLRYLHGKDISGKDTRVLKVIETLCPTLRHKKALKEIFVVRDLIFHNHLWELEYEIGGNPPMVLKGSSIDPNCGDTKFHDRANLECRRTKALRLNLNPIRIDRYDVIKVANTVGKTLSFFQRMNHSIGASLKGRFRHNGRFFSLEDYLMIFTKKDAQ